MAYVALYRSYRPTTFKEVIGQKHVVQTLKNAIMEGKTSHAYIFSGLRGIGKTTIARIFAKAVNCENPIDGEPCNCCKNCKAIINNETTDIIELDAASNNGVDEIRDILEKVNFPPSLLNKKVYIIDEAHMLSTAAFNALLKTLEEPPKHIMFILATTEPHKIPATILSRCQRFDFKQFSLDELKEELLFVSQKENIEIEKDAISAIAEASEGGMRDALSILDQASAYATGKITVEDINSVTGRISNYKLIELVKAFKEKDATKSICIIDELVDMGKEVNRLVASIIQFCRDILLYKNVNIKDNYKYIYDSEDFISLTKTLDTKELFYYIDVLVDIQNKIRYTSSSKIYLEVGIMKIINSANEDIDVLGKIQKLENTLDEKFGINITDNQDYNSKINTIDNKIKKLTDEFAKAKIDEFKEKMESKLDMLEDISSKNAALPTDLSYRLDDIEDKIRVINTTAMQADQTSLTKLSERLEKIENTINNNSDNLTSSNKYTSIKEEIAELNKNITVDAKNDATFDNNTYILLEERVKNLEEKVSNTFKNLELSSGESVVNTNVSERLKKLEDAMNGLINQTTTSQDEALLKEIEELKENYFVLVKAIKAPDTTSDNLDFDTDDLEANRSVNTDANSIVMMDQMIANINRLSDKIQANETNISKINEEVSNISIESQEQKQNISKIIDDINKIANNNKNDIYDEKFKDVDGRINNLEIKASNLNSEVSKIKQVMQDTRKQAPTTEKVEPVKPVVDIPKTEDVKKPEIQRTIQTNASKTLQTIKNVYDIRVIENILHEARERECREEKLRITSLWPKLEDKVGYAYAQIAKMLVDGLMVANGKTALLIVYKSAAICNHLMEPKNYTEAKQILRIHLGKDYDFIALPENTWQEKRNEYRGQFGIGIQRPKLTPINNPELNVVSVNYGQMQTAKTPSQIAKEAFGASLVEKEN